MNKDYTKTLNFSRFYYQILQDVTNGLPQAGKCRLSTNHSCQNQKQNSHIKEPLHITEHCWMPIFTQHQDDDLALDQQ